jgi:hypothetical protein
MTPARGRSPSVRSPCGLRGSGRWGSLSCPRRIPPGFLRPLLCSRTGSRAPRINPGRRSRFQSSQAPNCPSAPSVSWPSCRLLLYLRLRREQSGQRMRAQALSPSRFHQPASWANVSWQPRALPRLPRRHFYQNILSVSLSVVAYISGNADLHSQ